MSFCAQIVKTDSSNPLYLPGRLKGGTETIFGAQILTMILGTTLIKNNDHKLWNSSIDLHHNSNSGVWDCKYVWLSSWSTNNLKISGGEVGQHIEYVVLTDVSGPKGLSWNPLNFSVWIQE